MALLAFASVWRSGYILAQKIPVSNFPTAVPGENVKEVVSVTVH